MGKEDKSLLELAAEYLEKANDARPIYEIVQHVIEQKSIKKADIEDVTAQLIMDFMLSGDFVYVKNDCWDLKRRQPLSVIDKDGGDYKDYLADDEDAQTGEKELESSYDYDEEEDKIQSDDRDDEDKDNEDDDDDSLEKEFDQTVDDLESYESQIDEE